LISFPDIVIKALQQIKSFGYGQCLPIDEIRIPRQALKMLPLSTNRHDSTMQAFLYRGDPFSDKTYEAGDPS